MIKERKKDEVWKKWRKENEIKKKEETEWKI